MNKILEELMSDETSTGRLSIAAENAPIEVLSRLIQLSKHDSPLVREGAVEGLWHFSGNGAVVGRIKEMVKNDESPGVRRAAQDILDSL